MENRLLASCLILLLVGCDEEPRTPPPYVPPAADAEAAEDAPASGEPLPFPLDGPAPEPPSAEAFQTDQSGVPIAVPVPGKQGFVFSPYNSRIVDVRGIPSGTLVADPNYPASEKKRFRTP